MTLHMDENAVRANAAKIAGKAAKRKSRKIWALAGLGTLAAGGAAFAAVNLFGFGTLEQGPATMKNLTVASPKLTGSLVPGQSVGGTANVGNENDFPVKVVAVIVKDASVQTSGADCNPNTLTLNGTAPVTYPGGGAGHRVSLAAPVTIPAGEAKPITVANIISQQASATGLCGVKADFAVEAQVGNP
jgi:hypothetical protein